MPADSDERLTACPLCDLPLVVPALREREEADCPRCGATVAKRFRGDWHRVAAFASIALVALFVALGFSYLSLDSSGGNAAASALGVAWSVMEERPALGVLAGAFFLGAPALQCLAIFGLSVAFLRGRPSPRWRHVATLVERLGPWCMADVFLVGTLVSLIKIASLAEVSFGPSFWGFVFFVVYLVAAYASLDTKRVVAELHRHGS